MIALRLAVDIGAQTSLGDLGWLEIAAIAAIDELLDDGHHAPFTDDQVHGQLHATEDVCVDLDDVRDAMIGLRMAGLLSPLGRPAWVDAADLRGDLMPAAQVHYAAWNARAVRRSS